KTTKQATIRDSVTSGVRRVGLASRSGITEVARSGLLGRLRGGLERGPARGFLAASGVPLSGLPLGFDDGLPLGPGFAPGTATRTAWLIPSLDNQTRVDGSPPPPG